MFKNLLKRRYAYLRHACLCGDALSTLKQGSRVGAFRGLNQWSIVLLALMIPISTAGTHVALALFMCSWFFRGDLAEQVSAMRADSVRSTLGIALLFYLLFVGSSVYSPAPKSDILRYLSQMSKLLYLPFLWSVMARFPKRSWVLSAFLMSMCLTFILAFLKIYFKMPIVLSTRTFTAAAIFKDHIVSNLFMAYTAFVCAHAAVYGQVYTENGTTCVTLSAEHFGKHAELHHTCALRQVERSRKHCYRVLALIGLICSVYYCFFMSEGRSGCVILLGLWLLFLYQNRASKQRLCLGLAALLAVLAVVVLCSNVFQKRLIPLYQTGSLYATQGLQIPARLPGQDISVADRLDFMRHTWHLAKTRPWFGFGIGNFRSVYGASALQDHRQPSDNPHSEYLNIFFQYGLLGLAVLFRFFYSIYKNSLLLHSPEKECLQGLLLSIVLGCSFNSWLMDFGPGYFFVTLLAFFLSASSRPGRGVL